MYSITDIKKTLQHIEATLEGTETYLRDPYGENWPDIATGSILEISIYRPDYMPVLLDMVATGPGTGPDAKIFNVSQSCEFTRIMDSLIMTSIVTTNLIDTIPAGKPRLYRVK